MQIMRPCFALCLVALLSGCTPKMALVLFNYTGQSITVQDLGRSVVIPAGDHKEISFDGPYHEGNDLRGPVIQAGTHRWFYPVESTAAHRELIAPPGAYQRDIGLKRGYYVALDERGSLYLLSSALQSLAAARVSQPSGFPLKPQ